jgi:hypothetical protein
MESSTALTDLTNLTSSALAKGNLTPPTISPGLTLSIYQLYRNIILN